MIGLTNGNLKMLTRGFTKPTVSEIVCSAPMVVPPGASAQGETTTSLLQPPPLS